MLFRWPASMTVIGLLVAACSSTPHPLTVEEQAAVSESCVVSSLEILALLEAGGGADLGVNPAQVAAACAHAMDDLAAQQCDSDAADTYVRTMTDRRTYLNPETPEELNLAIEVRDKELASILAECPGPEQEDDALTNTLGEDMVTPPADPSHVLAALSPLG